MKGSGTRRRKARVSLSWGERERGGRRPKGQTKTHLEISRNFNHGSILSKEVESPFAVVGTMARFANTSERRVVD